MVNFSPSEEQELLRQTLASFSRDVLRPRLRESDEKDVVPAEIPPKAAPLFGWSASIFIEMAIRESKASD